MMRESIILMLMILAMTCVQGTRLLREADEESSAWGDF